MAEKLKSVLVNLYQKRRNQLLLSLKAIGFGATLAIAAAADFHPLLVLFFIAAALSMYARPLFDRYQTGFAFIILLLVSLLGMNIVSDSRLFFPALAVFSYIFYILLGVKGYLFVKRGRLYYLSTLLIFYALFVIFFLSNKSEWFLAKYLGVVIAAFLLFRAWLALVTSFNFPKREAIASAIAALLVAQMLWAVTILPIGFISSATILLLLVFALSDFLVKHFTGGISRIFTLQHLIFFTAIAAFIFFTSNWSAVAL